MKKRIMFLVLTLLLTLATICTACSVKVTAPNAAASGSTETAQNKITYSDLSREELESALTECRELIESLKERDKSLSQHIEDLETTVRQTISASKFNIGGYALNYTDCMLNLVCEDDRYRSSSSNAPLKCRGTGFIISEDGYVLTNDHVVSYVRRSVWDGVPEDTPYGLVGEYKLVTGEYKTITGYFDTASRYYDNCKGYNLELIYRDADYDLALCKLTAIEGISTWKTIPFFEGDAVRGNEVLVLGNAEGFGLSVTSGLISATQKTLNDFPGLTFIQTDAAINPGNSGGPMINIHGGLIGIVNCKFVGEEVDNMGFAIELDKVKKFISDAESKKEITVSYKTVRESATENAA